MRLQRLFSLYSLVVQMLFNPLDMLRLTFLTGEFGETLLGYGGAVISSHSRKLIVNERIFCAAFFAEQVLVVVLTSAVFAVPPR